MDETQVSEGTAAFLIDSVNHLCSTYYKIVGDLQSGRSPVVILHGGPGSGHEYMFPYAELWYRHGIPVIFYDQIGCGGSTLLPEKEGDKSFWCVELFVRELDNLVNTLRLDKEDGPGFHVLGHSAGGIFAACYAARRPRGLQRLVIASAPGSFDLHAVCLLLCRKQLPLEVRQALEMGVRTGDFQSQSYKDADMILRRTFWCRSDPFPPRELEIRKLHDPEERKMTVPTTMYGPSIHEVTGSMHGWCEWSAWSQVMAPTLVFHGEFDIERDEAIAPYLAYIPDTRKVTIPGVSHMAHLDNAESLGKVIDLVRNFLLEDHAV